jgi:hypothetical protein
MKRILVIFGIWVVVFLVGSSFSLRENPQDPPRGKKSEKHIRMVKIDEKGNKVELDTILQGDQVFVWQGDTIGGEMEWDRMGKDGFAFDSLQKDMDFDFSDEENFISIRTGKKNGPMIYEFRSDGDSLETFDIRMLKEGLQGEHNMEMWHDKNGEKRMAAPGILAPPVPPRVRFLGRQSQNVIDLGDDNVISYKKKKLSGGREKITVIRNEAKETGPEENSWENN